MEQSGETPLMGLVPIAEVLTRCHLMTARS
jgi:hypothetical protein